MYKHCIVLIIWKSKLKENLNISQDPRIAAEIGWHLSTSIHLCLWWDSLLWQVSKKNWIITPALIYWNLQQTWFCDLSRVRSLSKLQNLVIIIMNYKCCHEFCIRPVVRSTIAETCQRPGFSHWNPVDPLPRHDPRDTRSYGSSGWWVTIL